MTRYLFRLFALTLILTLAGCSDASVPTPGKIDEAAQVQSVHNFIASVATRFNSGDLEDFINVFTDDAQIISQGYPDIVGKQAIHDVYAAAMAQYAMKVTFHTAEVKVAGDMAYERGTYEVSYSDKDSGELLMTTHARHIHILTRDAHNGWRTWRMFTNTAEAEAPAAATEGSQ